MAIGRCSEHPFERVTKEPYNVYAFPLGYPQTAAICGRSGMRKSSAYLVDARSGSHSIAPGRACSISTVRRLRLA